MSALTKSPWILHYDASSCNGCDIEVLAALTPLFDAERFGVINAGNPKHADIFLITGSVNERQIGIIQQLYSQMLEPKVVVACGICACTGGVFKECYNTLGGVDVAIPVDVYAPGCAVRPESIIDAVVAGVGVLEEKRQQLAAGTLVPKELPPHPSAAKKVLEGESVEVNWQRTIVQTHEALKQAAKEAQEKQASGEQAPDNTTPGKQAPSPKQEEH